MNLAEKVIGIVMGVCALGVMVIVAVEIRDSDKFDPIINSKAHQAYVDSMERIFDSMRPDKEIDSLHPKVYIRIDEDRAMYGPDVVDSAGSADSVLIDSIGYLHMHQ